MGLLFETSSGCGVRLARTTLGVAEARPRMKELIDQAFRDIPCGTGGAGHIRIGEKQLNEVLVKGGRWMVDNGYGEASDEEFCEERARLEGAVPNQLGSNKHSGRSETCPLQLQMSAKGQKRTHAVQQPCARLIQSK